MRAVWAISDLHLSFARPERRDRFGARWRDHADRIARNWRDVVGPSDLVLLPGDLSMARNHREVQPDLEWLGGLPGLKVLAPGNHDQWWNGAGPVRRILRRRMFAVDGDAVDVEGVIVCGAAGAPPLAGEEDEAGRVAAAGALQTLATALEQAGRLRPSPDSPIYVLWHYPPFDAHRRPGPCVDLLERAAVTACVYGHLHIQSQWSTAVQGTVGGVRYHCVAADAIGFRPVAIGRPPRSSVAGPRRPGT